MGTHLFLISDRFYFVILFLQERVSAEPDAEERESEKKVIKSKIFIITFIYIYLIMKMLKCCELITDLLTVILDVK